MFLGRPFSWCFLFDLSLPFFMSPVTLFALSLFFWVLHRASASWLLSFHICASFQAIASAACLLQEKHRTLYFGVFGATLLLVFWNAPNTHELIRFAVCLAIFTGLHRNGPCPRLYGDRDLSIFGLFFASSVSFLFPFETVTLFEIVFACLYVPLWCISVNDMCGAV